MSDQLGSASRALLDAAREGLTPDPTAIARVRGKVSTAVAGGVTGGIATKLFVLATVGVVASGALYATHDPDEQAAPAITFVVEREQPAPAAPLIVPAARVETEMEPMVIPRPRKGAEPVRRGVTLAREVELIDQAMAALRKRDLSAALVAARTHATETAGRGQLAEDASAIEIEALCRLRDPAADSKLVAFDTRWPHSAQRSRITAACP